MAIDPGVMSGYCYGRIDVNGFVEVFPFQMTDDVDDLYRRLAEFQPRHLIVEDFEYRSGKHTTGLNLFPVQLIGVARLYELNAPDGKCALRLQKAAQGKAYYSDMVLKTMNLYKRGVPHGTDAMRHLLQWLTFGSGYQYITQDTNFVKLLESW
jgi:hypothetical protein